MKNYIVNNYRGCLIYENENSQRFGTRYFSVVNPNINLVTGGQPHCHATTRKMAQAIVDAFQDISKYGSASKYSREIRNRAMRLNGIMVLSKY